MLSPVLFPKNISLHDSGSSLPVFPFGTNLKLHNNSVTPKMAKVLNAKRNTLENTFEITLRNTLETFLLPY